jgi:hypothetical protein
MDLENRINSLTDEQLIENEEQFDDAIEGIGNPSAKRRVRRTFNNRRRSAYANVARKRSRKGNTAQMQAVASVFNKSTSAKAKFEVMKKQLPQTVQAELASGKLQVNDAYLYAIKNINGKQTKQLFEPSDDYKVGDTNLNRAQLDSGKYFLLTGIRLEFGYDYLDEGAATNVLFNNSPAETFNTLATDTAAERANLVAMSKQFANFLQGHFQLEVGTNVIVPEIPIDAFVKNADDEPVNTIMLDNPKLIDPLKEIKPEIQLPAAAAKVFVRVTLIGAWTEKN